MKLLPAVKFSAFSLCLAAVLLGVVGLAVPGASAQSYLARRNFLEFKDLAEKGEAAAQYELGRRYEGGLGAEKDYTEAMKWYRKAAEQNYAQAQLSLGVCYYTGRGVAKDTAEALRWYRKAAEKDSGVQWMLGVYYDSGVFVEQDETEAAKLYRKAADQDHALAQWNLARCYLNGSGVEKDYTQAYAWFNLAGKTVEDARKGRDQLERKMSPEQVDAGQKRTQELRAQIEAKLKSNGK